MTYKRTPEQKALDFKAAREYEQRFVDLMNLPSIVTEFDHPDRLDIWQPGWFLDIKEKRQRLTRRWQLWPGVEERDLFVIDELSVRRACRHWPYAYFALRDIPGGDRLFVASVVELACVERVRIDRDHKGKWLLDLNRFRRVQDPADIPALILDELQAMPWKQSGCVSPVVPIPQV